MPLDNILKNRLQKIFTDAQKPTSGWEDTPAMEALFEEKILAPVNDGVSAALIVAKLEKNQARGLVRYATQIHSDVLSDALEEPITDDSFFPALEVIDMLANDQSNILLTKAQEQISLARLKMDYDDWVAAEARRPERPAVDHLLSKECA